MITMISNYASLFNLTIWCAFSVILVTQSYQYVQSYSKKSGPSHIQPKYDEKLDDTDHAPFSAKYRDPLKHRHKNTISLADDRNHRFKQDRYESFDYDRYFAKGYDDRAEDDEAKDDDEDSIEEISDEKIAEIVQENDKNLLVFFFDRNNKCPTCKNALQVLEEIDDDLESTGFIEVVKSKHKRTTHEAGVSKVPGMVYYRRKNPIIYDGNFEESSETLLRWIRAHEEVLTVDLDDSNFEDKTNSYSPHKSSLDWFVLFYSSKKPECNSYVATWEAVAYKLRGMINVGKVDVHESDDVAIRFNIHDDDDCPTIILFRKGKMYRFRDASKDINVLTHFALHKYKDHRGRRVPEPPTVIQELFELVKECLGRKLGEHKKFLASFVSLAFLLAVAFSTYLFWKSRKQQTEEKSKDF